MRLFPTVFRRIKKMFEIESTFDQVVIRMSLIDSLDLFSLTFAKPTCSNFEYSSTHISLPNLGTNEGAQ